MAPAAGMADQCAGDPGCKDGKKAGAGVPHLPALERGCGHAAHRGQFCRERTHARVGEDHLGDQGWPVACAALRGALMAVRQASGVLFDVDGHTMDQRTNPPR